MYFAGICALFMLVVGYGLWSLEVESEDRQSPLLQTVLGIYGSIAILISMWPWPENSPIIGMHPIILMLSLGFFPRKSSAIILLTTVVTRIYIGGSYISEGLVSILISAIVGIGLGVNKSKIIEAKTKYIGIAYFLSIYIIIDFILAGSNILMLKNIKITSPQDEYLYMFKMPYMYFLGTISFGILFTTINQYSVKYKQLLLKSITSNDKNRYILDIKDNLQLFIESTKSSIWEANCINGKLESVIGFGSQFNYKENNIPKTIDEMLQLINYADRKKLDTIMNECFKSSRSEFQINVRIIDVDDRLKWVTAHLMVKERDSQQRVIKYLMMYHDINDLKSYADRLQSIASAQRSIISNLPSALFILTSDKYVCLEANDYIENIIGHKISDIINRPINESLSNFSDAPWEEILFLNGYQNKIVTAIFKNKNLSKSTGVFHIKKIIYGGNECILLMINDISDIVLKQKKEIDEVSESKLKIIENSTAEKIYKEISKKLIKISSNMESRSPNSNTSEIKNLSRELMTLSSRIEDYRIISKSEKIDVLPLIAGYIESNRLKNELIDFNIIIETNNSIHSFAEIRIDGLRLLIRSIFEIIQSFHKNSTTCVVNIESSISNYCKKIEISIPFGMTETNKRKLFELIGQDDSEFQTGKEFEYSIHKINKISDLLGVNINVININNYNPVLEILLNKSR